MSCPKCGLELDWEESAETIYYPTGPVTKTVKRPFVICKNGHRYGFDPRQSAHLIEITEEDGAP